MWLLWILWILWFVDGHRLVTFPLTSVSVIAQEMVVPNTPITHSPVIIKHDVHVSFSFSLFLLLLWSGVLTAMFRCHMAGATATIKSAVAIVIMSSLLLHRNNKNLNNNHHHNKSISLSFRLWRGVPSGWDAVPGRLLHHDQAGRSCPPLQGALQDVQQLR